MTHAEAATLYPVREPFGAARRPSVDRWGKAFERAKARAAALGLSRVVRDDGLVERDHLPDGVILPGLVDGEDVPPLARWLGSVTLYYRPRAVSGA